MNHYNNFITVDKKTNTYNNNNILNNRNRVTEIDVNAYFIKIRSLYIKCCSRDKIT